MVVGGGVIVATIVLRSVMLLSRTGTPAARASTAIAAPTTTSADQLALRSTTGAHSSANHWTVQGQVTNLTDRPLTNVAAVSTWYTTGGTFISSDTALVEYNPLMPGQTSPFKVITRGNPQMAKDVADA